MQPVASVSWNNNCLFESPTATDLMQGVERSHGSVLGEKSLIDCACPCLGLCCRVPELQPWKSVLESPLVLLDGLLDLFQASLLGIKGNRR